MESATNPGAAARSAQRQKRARYADLAQHYYRFEQLPMENMDTLGPAFA